MQTFVKRPVEVHAVQWTGDNTAEVVEFVDGKPRAPHSMGNSGMWLKQKVVDPNAKPVMAIWFLVIPTPEGDMEASVGDWIIRGNGSCRFWFLSHTERSK